MIHVFVTFRQSVLFCSFDIISKKSHHCPSYSMTSFKMSYQFDTPLPMIERSNKNYMKGGGNDKPTDGGADAGTGASATSESVESRIIFSRNSIGFSSAKNLLSSTQLADEKQKAFGTPAGRLVGLTQKTLERDLIK